MILLSSSLNSFIQLLGALAVFVFVLVITYYTTKWLGGLQKTYSTGKNLKVVESVRIANNKFVQIIRIGNLYLVIAVGKDEVTMLAQLTEDQLAEAAEKIQDATSQVEKDSFSGVQETFQETLKKMKDRFPKKQD